MNETPYARALELLTSHAAKSGAPPTSVSAASGAAGVCAFDGDGTLWAGDVGEDFLHHVLEENAFTDVAARLFRDEIARTGLTASTHARDDLARLFRAYTEGAYPEESICGLIALAVAGRSVDDVARVSADVVRARDVRGRLHAETVGILEESQARGLEVVIVSASPRAVVVAAAAVVGLSANAVIAVTPREDRGVVGATLDEPIPYGEGKATRLRERLSGRPLVVCAGDNAFDMAMLKLAAVPLAIRPKDRLRKIAHELPSLTILGRLEG